MLTAWRGSRQRIVPFSQKKKVQVLFRLGTAPTQEQSILGVLLRAIYNHIIIIIQLFLRGAVSNV